MNLMNEKKRKLPDPVVTSLDGNEDLKRKLLGNERNLILLKRELLGVGEAHEELKGVKRLREVG